MLFKKFAPLFFFLVFSTHAFSMEAEDDGVRPFPYLMRAMNLEGNSALFVATHHDFPWECLPEEFKKQVLSKNVGVFEAAEKRTPEVIMRGLSKEFLPTEVFLPEEKFWKASSGHEILQESYSKIARLMNEKGFDYSYLDNISTVCPGFLAYLNVLSVYANGEARPEGMDSSLYSIFEHQGKPSFFLETRNSEDIRDTDAWKSFSMTTASYDDVRADLDTVFITKSQNLLEDEKKVVVNSTLRQKRRMSIEGLRSFQGELQHQERILYQAKRIPSILFFNNAMEKRNQLWMPTILNQVSTNEAVIAAGVLHFVGTGGIIFLGQKEGLKWQYYNYEKDEWENFTYTPDPPKPTGCLVS
jgi:hypothetical protein